MNIQPQKDKGKFNKTISVRLSQRDIDKLKARGNRLGLGMNALIRLLAASPLRSDAIALKLQPLFQAADSFKAALDSIALYESQLDEPARQSLRKTAIEARRKLLLEIDLLRATAELGRLNEPSR